MKYFPIKRLRNKYTRTRQIIIVNGYTVNPSLNFVTLCHQPCPFVNFIYISVSISGYTKICMQFGQSDKMKKCLLVIVLAFSTFGTVWGVPATDYKSLQKTLMTDYSNKVRPVQDQDDTVYVMTSFILADLNDVDAVQQRLVTTAYLRIVWIDEFLKWDKATTGIEMVYFKQVIICCSYLSIKN